MLGVDYTCEQGGQIQILNNRRKVWVTCCHGGVPVRALQDLAVPKLVPHGSVVLAPRESPGKSGLGTTTSFLSESSHYFGSDDDDGDDEDEEEDKQASHGANETGPRAGAQLLPTAGVHTRDTKLEEGSTTTTTTTATATPSLDSASAQPPPRAPMDDELICKIFGSMEKFRSVVLGGGTDGRRRTRQVIVGLDPLEALRGIPLKLLAFDRFLSENRDWASRVVLVQIGLELDSRPDDYARVSRDVDMLVDALRRRWGDALFYCRLPSVTTAERKRLWQVCVLLYSGTARSSSIPSSGFVRSAPDRAAAAGIYIYVHTCMRIHIFLFLFCFVLIHLPLRRQVVMVAMMTLPPSLAAAAFYCSFTC